MVDRKNEKYYLRLDWVEYRPGFPESLGMPLDFFLLMIAIRKKLQILESLFANSDAKLLKIQVVKYLDMF